jgi:hypothetical protein
MKHRLRTVALWLLVLAVLVGLGALAIRHRGERALERKLAELRAQGEKLTVRELFGEPSPGDAQHHARFDGVLKQLPQPPAWASSAERMKLFAPGRARVLWSNAVGVPDGAKANVFLATWEDAARDIRGVDVVLDQVRVELATPPRSTGADFDRDPLNAPMPNLVTMRIAALWLSAAVALNLHEDDVESALANLTGLLNLTLAYEGNPTLVCQMIRVAISGLAAGVTWDALHYTGWTEPQLAHLQATWQRFNPTVTAASTLEAERAFILSVSLNLRSRNAPSLSQVTGVPPSPGVVLVDTAWREIFSSRDIISGLNEMQTLIQSARLLRDDAAWPQIDSLLAVEENRRIGKATWVRAVTHPITTGAIPNLRKALGTVARNETLRQMTLAAIAIRRYELRHGRPPASLDALVPALLSKLPHDSFSGQPLRYRLTDTGGYVLYSVGLDGQDDGGDTTPTTNNKSWTIWDSRDAVWPKPLEE